MKILRNFFTVTALGLAVVACNNAPEETVEAKEAEEVAQPEETSVTYAVVTEGDEIMWEGYKTIGNDKHTGTLQVSEGEFMVEDNSIAGGSFVIDMTSIHNEDLPEEGDYNKAKLEGHLKSEDFFAVEEYPKATFTITKVEPAEHNDDHAEGEGNHAHHMVSGNLMMRGTEKNITFPAMIEMKDDMVMLSTPEFVIDRTNWNVMYGSSNITSVAKDKAIDNNIKLKLDVKAKKA